jgi:hypothetical protein
VGTGVNSVRTVSFAGVAAPDGANYPVTVDTTNLDYILPVPASSSVPAASINDAVSGLATVINSFLVGSTHPYTASASGSILSLTAGAGTATLAASAITASGSTTPRAFPLRLIVHVNNSGTANLLSQAFVGNLAATGHAPGVCIHEGGLWADTKADALRLVSSQMPLDRVIPGTGSFATGGTLTYSVSVPFDDVTNPFVHTYHPDHDNKDARGLSLAAGVESYTITRTIKLTFTATPPDGSTVSGWGTTVFGGTYAETITGLSRLPLTVGGNFAMRRVSEVADLDTTTQ